MKNRLLLAALAIVCTLLLTACDECEHNWKKATCENPKTCTLCGETQGDVKDHVWVEATCEKPKTCSLCGETEGEPVEHIWSIPTSKAPMFCCVCGKTEGEPLDTPLLGVESFIGESPETFLECLEGLIERNGYSLEYESHRNPSSPAYRIFHDGESTEMLLILSTDEQGCVSGATLTGAVTSILQPQKMEGLVLSVWGMVAPGMDISSIIDEIEKNHTAVTKGIYCFEIVEYNSTLTYIVGLQ